MNAAQAPCKNVGTGADQSGCLVSAARNADDELGTVYRRIMATLDSHQKVQLDEAQQVWFRYRDQTCVAERDLYGGGTGGLAAYPACLEALTRHRISDLTNAYWWRVRKFRD